MPKAGVGSGIALGVATAADNFYKNFMAAKQMKQQNKWRKLEPVVGVIMSRINDPNISLDDQIQAIDSLPHILGLKVDMPLSHQMGLDKIAAQQTELEAANPSQTITDPNATAYSQQLEKKQLKSVGSGSTQQTADDGTIINSDSPIIDNIQTQATPAILQRRGSLSSSDLDLRKRLKIVSAERLADFDKEKQLAVLGAELQDKVLSKQGWEKEGDWTLNTETKTWGRVWTNPRTKETFNQDLPPNVVPESIVKEQTKAGAKGNVSKAYSTLRTAIATSMGLEEDDPKVQTTTAEMWKNNFAAGTEFKLQGAEGTRKIQPAQQKGLDLQTLAAQQKHGELVASAGASKTNVDSLADRKGKAWQTAADAKVDFDMIKEDYEPDYKEYQVAQNAYNKATDDANRLETEYQQALKSHETLTQQVKISEQNLKSSGINNATPTNPTLTTKQKAYVNKYFSGDVQRAIEYNQSKGKTFP